MLQAINQWSTQKKVFAGLLITTALMGSIWGVMKITAAKPKKKK